jgi:aminopeptidase N
MAARFMRDLRAEMGQETFQAFLADYYNQNSYQFATAQTFFAIANAHLPSEKLHPLTQQYFQNPPPN